MLKKASLLVIVIFCLSSGCIANAASTPTDVIIFIPGFGGSKLQDAQGKNVWGDLKQMKKRFSELELSQTQQQPPLIAYGILDSVSILGPFTIGYYEGLLKSLGKMGYIRNKNLFLFPYDWRQSNFDTALKLKSFIEKEKTQAFEGKQITIIAHSMGGLVASIYIQKYGGEKRVGKLITMGTPYYGAPEALRIFFKGLGPVENNFLGGPDKVIRVFSSFPATYELLPNYKNSCILGLSDDKKRTPIDVLDMQRAMWKNCDWLKAMQNRKDFVNQSLGRAKELAELMRTPPKVKHYKIVGDLYDTLTRVYFKDICEPSEWVPYRGDGTVPLESAMADRRETADPTIERHSNIFNDKHVVTRLGFLLTRDEWIEKYAYTEISGWVETEPNGSLISISGIDVDNRTPFIPPGGPLAIAVTIFDKNRNPIRAVAVRGSLIDADGSSKALQVTSETNGAYLATTAMPSMPGPYTIKIDVPGIGQLEEYVAVLDDLMTE